MVCESMLFVKNHIPYLWNLWNSLSNSFNDFYSYEGFHQVIYQKEWSIKLRIDNGGWHETLTLLQVSRCEMLHFVMSYTKQNKSREQTLESVRYRLEINFMTHELNMSRSMLLKCFGMRFLHTKVNYSHWPKVKAAWPPVADPDLELTRGGGGGCLACLQAFLPSVISCFFTQNAVGWEVGPPGPLP